MEYLLFGPDAEHPPCQEGEEGGTTARGRGQRRGDGNSGEEKGSTQGAGIATEVRSDLTPPRVGRCGERRESTAGRGRRAADVVDSITPGVKPRDAQLESVVSRWNLHFGCSTPSRVGSAGSGRVRASSRGATFPVCPFPSRRNRPGVGQGLCMQRTRGCRRYRGTPWIRRCACPTRSALPRGGDGAVAGN
jgi:hypothetical protein